MTRKVYYRSESDYYSDGSDHTDTSTEFLEDTLPDTIKLIEIFERLQGIMSELRLCSVADAQDLAFNVKSRKTLPIVYDTQDLDLSRAYWIKTFVEELGLDFTNSEYVCFYSLLVQNKYLARKVRHYHALPVHPVVQRA